MFKGRLLVLCVLLSASAYAPAQQTSPSTVEEFVRIGIERNQDLAAVREGIAEARGLKRQAGVRPAPGRVVRQAGPGERRARRATGRRARAGDRRRGAGRAGRLGLL